MLSYISKTLACVLMGISLPLHLKHMKGHEMYSSGQLGLGALSVVISGSLGAILASIFIGKNFDEFEKRI